MKKIAFTVFFSLVCSVVNAGTFYVQDVPGLQSSVDNALARTQTGRATAFDARGNKYRVHLVEQGGGCRTGVVIDSNGNTAQSSICRQRRINNSLRTVVSKRMTPAQQMQYSRNVIPTPSRQSYAGWFKEEPGLQYDLRGNPNAPFMNVDSLNANLNDVYAMSDEQFARYQARVNWVNDHVVPQTARNDREYARNAQTWMGDTNQDRYSTQETLGRNFDTLLNRAINSIDF